MVTTIFSTLGSTDAAFVTQQIAEIVEGDNKGLTLLLPIILAIAWVLFNILQLALNQLNKMRSEKGIVVGLGGGISGGLVALGLTPPDSASVGKLLATTDLAEAYLSDSMGFLLLIVVAPTIG